MKKANKDGADSKNLSSIRQDFVTRLEQCVEQAGNVAALSRLCGISTATIWDYLAGKSDPTREKVIAIAQSLGISAGWLATGEGNPPSRNTRSYTSPTQSEPTAFYDSRGQMPPGHTIRLPIGPGESVEVVSKKELTEKQLEALILQLQLQLKVMRDF